MGPETVDFLLFIIMALCVLEIIVSMFARYMQRSGALATLKSNSRLKQELRRQDSDRGNDATSNDHPS